ncbi:hypothetical protein J6U78_07570 [bacterium]|nr:hypothetical protein [bacterium]
MDSKNNTMLKAYVFIARDDEEYNKYIFPEDLNASKNQSSDLYQWRYCHKTNSLRMIFNKRGIGQNGWDYLSPADGKLRIYMEELNKATDNAKKEKPKKEINAECKELFGLNGDIAKIIKGIKDQLCRIYLDYDNPLFVDNEQFSVVIFIHWGGGDQYDLYEETIQKQLPNYWKIYSIGTGRKVLLNIDVDQIEIPTDVDALCQKFENKKKPDMKNILTKFIVGVNLEQGEKILIADFFSKKAVRADLRSALRDPQMKWLNQWESLKEFLDEKDDIQLKSKVFNMMENDKDKSKALFTQLLTIPQLISEEAFV